MVRGELRALSLRQTGNRDADARKYGAEACDSCGVEPEEGGKMRRYDRLVKAGVVLAIWCMTTGATYAQDAAKTGKATFEKTCALCHGPGLAGAPKFGDAAAW